jgi:hypothetical protein
VRENQGIIVQSYFSFLVNFILAVTRVFQQEPASPRVGRFPSFIHATHFDFQTFRFLSVLTLKRDIVAVGFHHNHVRLSRSFRLAIRRLTLPVMIDVMR